jgi:hypothetical protein
MELAPPGTLADLGPLVLGDHALELDEEGVLGTVGRRRCSAAAPRAKTVPCLYRT